METNEMNVPEEQMPQENNHSNELNEHTPAKKHTRKHHSAFRGVLSVVLVLAMVAGSCGITYSILNSQWEEKAQASADSISKLEKQVSALQSGSNVVADTVTYAGTSDGEMTPKEVYEKNAQSVVAVSSTIQTTTYGRTTQGTSTGSGFIISDDGYVVTNYHVVEGATAVTVTLSDDNEYEAEIIGSDSANDVAVLKIEASGLPYVTLGSSDELAIGDYVVAIGNPLGSLTATMTFGIVSGKDRQVTTDNATINMIQTDAAINSGNSGGPLFNMKGEVVGITTAKYSGTTSSGASIEGVGFAIPIDDVMSIIGDLQQYGYVTGAYLGVTVSDTDASAAKLYGMPTGAYVNSVVDDGSADRAGIQAKDIIIAIGDTEVSSVNELTRALRRFKAGDETTITVIRSGQQITMDITLDEKPQDLDSSNSSTADSESNMPEDGEYSEWYKYFFGDK